MVAKKEDLWERVELGENPKLEESLKQEVNLLPQKRHKRGVNQKWEVKDNQMRLKVNQKEERKDFQLKLKKNLQKKLKNLWKKIEEFLLILKKKRIKI